MRDADNSTSGSVHLLAEDNQGPGERPCAMLRDS